MNPEDAAAEPAGTDPAITADLRQRLRGSEVQRAATRSEARRLSRELALTRRLLRFSLGGSQPAAPATPRRAVKLTEPVLFHLDACRRAGTHTVISGWAFRPVPGWDARAAMVTLLFRAGVDAYAAAASHSPRPDVAAYLATRKDQAAGGARGLDGAGFSCEIVNDSLPAGVDLEIVLRLECAGLTCEQPTGRRLRL